MRINVSNLEEKRITEIGVSSELELIETSEPWSTFGIRDSDRLGRVSIDIAEVPDLIKALQYILKLGNENESKKN